jgi:hypothetical protein
MRPYLKKTHHKKRAGGVAQGIGFEFKSQYQKKSVERVRGVAQVLEFLPSM